jgi:S1-C subfamily serine protease
MPGSDDDDDPRRPPPHPLDRTWIHPSELGAARATPSGAPSRPAAPGHSWRRDAAFAVTAGAIGALATVLVLAAVGAFDAEPRPPARTTSVPVSTDAAAIAARVAPGVAAIAVTAGAGNERRGSGIVVGPHELLTTKDVVGAADTTGAIRVSVVSGHEHRATVGAADPVSGLVLLRVPGVRMQPAQLGTPEDVRAGDWVVAVGRMATSGPWVTSGVVTATRGWTQGADGVAHPGLITTNTAVVDEARGGALVDGRGRIVGILAMTGAGTPRASAMPADMADEVATQLTEKGRATHGALGVQARDTGAGPVVTEVVAGSSAARAHVRVDDRIVAIDAAATPDTATLVYELRLRQAGTNARVTLQRGKHRVVVTATLDDAAASSAAAAGGAAPLSLTLAGPG